MKEAGVPDFDIYTWFGLMVPGSTPDDIGDELNAAIVPVLPAPNTPAEFSAMVEREAEKYKMLVKISGARVD